jgi:16S rRNA pseudouridine516 synthase
MLLSPARHVEKTYFVRYDGTLAPDAEARFRNGIAIPADDGDPACVCMPAELIRAGEQEARVKVTEGRYHQVKRMIAAVGGHVTYLRRETFGPLTLDADLRPGAYRELLREEITQIEEIKRKTRRQT